MADVHIHPLRNTEDRDAALALLVRFFAEEGFATLPDAIGTNLDLMQRDPTCWVALAWSEGKAVGVVTVTTMLYIEWGRLGEVGDLYVVPEARGRGVARALVGAAKRWCLARGCSAVTVVVAPDGEQRHGLSKIYAGLGFAPTGRTIMTLSL